MKLKIELHSPIKESMKWTLTLDMPDAEFASLNGDGRESEHHLAVPMIVHKVVVRAAD